MALDISVSMWLARIRKCFLALAVILPLLAQASGGNSADMSEVLVKLRSADALPPLLAKYSVRVLGQFGTRPIFRLATPPGSSANDIAAAIALEPDVVIAEPNAVHQSPEARKNVVWAIGSATEYAAQWAPAAMRLTEAHHVTSGSVRVAVLDTGIETRHPAFAGKLLQGFDFVDFDLDPSEVGTPSNAGFGHGTHVAGLVLLAAPGAKIMPVRVLDPEGQGNAWVLAEALLYAVDPDGNPDTDDGANVINLSLAGVTRTRLLESVSQLVSCSTADPAEAGDDFSDAAYDDDKARCNRFGGAVVVAAAGNDGSDAVREYPAAESAYGEIAVGATTATGGRAAFSNFGSWVDIAAPGDRVTSTVPGGGYGTWSGTSMAAPLVAGVAALLRSIEPNLSPEDVVRRLVRTATPLCYTTLRQIDALAVLADTSGRSLACR
jgi:subtilisin family serine protease